MDAAPTPEPPSDAGRLRLLRLTGWGFAIGSTLFAVGVPLSLLPDASPALAGWTFFLGSIFFTAAAATQLMISARGLPDPPPEAAAHGAWFSRLIRPRTADWTASALQFAGTLLFNLSTFRSALDAAGAQTSYDLIWRPDLAGSILFLDSSAMAFAPEVRRRRHGHARDRSWTIGALNMGGSVFFGFSAIGAYLVPSTNDLLNAQWSNGGTLLGALCFLVGSVLLIPSRARATS